MVNGPYEASSGQGCPRSRPTMPVPRAALAEEQSPAAGLLEHLEALHHREPARMVVHTNMTMPSPISSVGTVQLHDRKG